MRNVHTFIFFLFFALTSVANNTKSDSSLNAILTHADSLYNSQNYTEALDYYIKGMKLAEKDNFSEEYLICIGYIANIYQNFGDKSNCKLYLEKGYNGAKKAENNNLKNSFLINLVRVTCSLKDVENAKKYYKILQETPPDVNIDDWKYYLIYNKASISFAENKYEDAIKAHLEALKFAKEKKLGVTKEMYQENEIANVYLCLKDFENALKWGKLCEERALKKKNTELLVNAYNVLYITYGNKGDDNNEKKYHHLYTEMKDSLYNIYSFFESTYKLKEYENKQMKSTYSSRSIMILLAIIIIVILISTYFYKKRHKKEEEEKEKKNDNDTVLLNDDQIEEIYVKIDKLMNDTKYIYNPDFSLQMLADDIQSNTKYVSWVINNKYQQNFKSLLNNKRIEEACKMLEDDDICKNYTIQSIYEKIGYKNATSFIRAFKKIVGTTPAEYRKSKQQ